MVVFVVVWIEVDVELVESLVIGCVVDDIGLGVGYL